MHVFITGGTGFIGRPLIDRLLDMGWRVTALVRSSNHGLPGGVRTVTGDIIDPESLRGLGEGCDLLIHLAGLISFDPDMTETLLHVNANGTDYVLNMARKCRISKSVIVSSACTFGISFSKDNRMDETSVPDPVVLANNPYMISKVEAEKIALNYSKDQDIVIVNPTTVYGEGDRTLNSGTLIKKIYTSLILPVPPGGCNVIDVSDVVEGIIKAALNGESGKKYILSGENFTFSSLFSMISDALNKKPFLVYLYPWMRSIFSTLIAIMGKITGNRFFTRQIADDLFAFKYYSCERAKSELDWIAKIDFTQSVSRALNFYKNEGLL